MPLPLQIPKESLRYYINSEDNITLVRMFPKEKKSVWIWGRDLSKLDVEAE